MTVWILLMHLSANAPGGIVDGYASMQLCQASRLSLEEQYRHDKGTWFNCVPVSVEQR